MDVIDQAPPPTLAMTGPVEGSVGWPAYAQASLWGRRCRGLTLGIAAASVSVLGVWWAARFGLAPSVLSGLLAGGLVPVALTSLLILLAACTGIWILAVARRRVVTPPRPHSSRWRRLLRRGQTGGAGQTGDAGLIGKAARWPQTICVGALSAAAVLPWWLMPQPPPGAPANAVIAAGAAALVLAFPLLLAERWLATVPASVLPEAAPARALFLLAIVAWLVAGMVQIALGFGLSWALWFDRALLAFLTLVAAELCARALARCFLPPPAPAEARAACVSLLARLLADGVRARSVVAPVRQNLGIDFSRSWALMYLRAATPPVLVVLALLCWGLTGVILVPPDQRAVYERFGAPVAVLHPGAHVTLPWPLGRARMLDYGVIHEVALTPTPASAVTRRVGAEDPAPPEADRLWDQAHPAELDFLIASGGGAQQNFQVVSADIRLRYRIGLSDASALLAAYRVSDPLALLRASAGRVIGGFFTSQTLDAVLGEDRDAMAAHLGAVLQHDLDQSRSGIEVTSVVIEAIHPPAGAAEAYHEVQAAEIRANTSIEAERGKAAAVIAKARLDAHEIVTQAQAAAAEVTGTATADLTVFTAEHAAAVADGDSFLLERRLSAIAAGIGKSPLTIIDHRIPAENAPVLDLRPMTPVTSRSTGAPQE